MAANDSILLLRVMKDKIWLFLNNILLTELRTLQVGLLLAVYSDSNGTYLVGRKDVATSGFPVFEVNNDDDDIGFVTPGGNCMGWTKVSICLIRNSYKINSRWLQENISLMKFVSSHLMADLLLIETVVL